MYSIVLSRNVTKTAIIPLFRILILESIPWWRHTHLESETDENEENIVVIRSQADF